MAATYRTYLWLGKATGLTATAITMKYFIAQAVEQQQGWNTKTWKDDDSGFKLARTLIGGGYISIVAGTVCGIIWPITVPAAIVYYLRTPD